MSAIGKENGNHGVDTQQVEREWRQVFIVSHTGASKGVMRFPIRRHSRGKHFLGILYRSGLYELAQSCLALIVQMCQLRDSDMREVLRSESQKPPLPVVHRGQVEFMSQVFVFIPQFGKVSVVQSIFLVSFRYGVQFQQSCLPHEDGLYLENVVTVMSHGLQRYMESPFLKGFAIDTKAEVACQGHEISILPVTIASSYPILYGIGFLL